MSDDLQAQLAEATKVAMTSMQESSELGIVLRFLTDSFNVTSYKELADLLFQVLEQFSLNAILQIEINNEEFAFGAKAEPTRMELSLIRRAREKERIFSKDDITVLSFTHAFLMIKNMPEDEVLRGRYRDLLAHFAAGLDSRIRGLSIEHIMRTQSRDTVNAIRSIRQLSEDNQGHMSDVLNNLMTEFEVAIAKIADNDDEEAYFSGIINRCLDDLDVLSKSGLALESHFMNIVSGYKRGFEIIDEMRSASSSS